ncbi:galactokinase family protein [Corynebacterium sp. ZY180755]
MTDEIHSASDLVQRACDLHSAAFGEDPVATAAAPGSWSLIGEHTDPYGGVVLLSLTDLRTVAAISPRNDRAVVVEMETFDHRTGEFDRISDKTTLDKVATFSEDKEKTSFTVAEHLGGLVQTMMHRQMLSRDTAGFSIAISSTIPEKSGLGGDVALDVSVALAVGHGIDDLNVAPVRAKLADVCYQASQHFADYPSVRARYTAALRGHANALNVVDYSDGSITQASHPVGPSTRTSALLITAGAQESYGELIKERHKFIEDAGHAFAASSLRLLPEAPTRVVDWLAAIHEVNGPEGVPEITEASMWMNFLEAETADAVSTSQAIRSRRHGDIFPILNRSQQHMDSELGVVSDAERALAQLCLSRGALSARSSESGASTAVVAIVESAHATNFTHDLAADGLSVIELLPGEPAN